MEPGKDALESTVQAQTKVSNQCAGLVKGFTELNSEAVAATAALGAVTASATHFASLNGQLAGVATSLTTVTEQCQEYGAIFRTHQEALGSLLREINEDIATVKSTKQTLRKEVANTADAVKLTQSQLTEAAQFIQKELHR